MRKINLLVLLALTFIFNGCWYYSFTQTAYPEIESVQIIPFENTTTEYDIPDEVTNKLIESIDGSGLLEVRSKGADSQLEGSIIYFDRQVYTYTDNEQPIEYKLTIRAKVKFTDTGKDKILWDATIEGYGTYEADAVDDSEAREEALELLIQRIIQRVREG